MSRSVDYTVYLPEKLTRALEKAGILGLDPIERDRYLVFLSELARRQRRRSAWQFVTMKADILGQLLSETRYRDVLDRLISEKIILTDGRYIPSRKSFGYRIYAAFRKGRPVSHYIECGRQRNRLRKFRESIQPKTEEALSHHEVHAHLLAGAKAVSIDLCTLPQVEQSNPTVVEALKHAPRHTPGATPWICMDDGGRVYTWTSQVAGRIKRRAFRIGGEELVAFDLGKSYFRSAILLYAEGINGNDLSTLVDLYRRDGLDDFDLYRWIGGDRGRKYGKEAVQAMLCNSNSWSQKAALADKALEGCGCAPFVSWVRALRRNNCLVWSQWVERERQTMNRLYERFVEMGWSGKFIDEHDGFRIVHSLAPPAAVIVAQVLAEDDAKGCITGGLGRMKIDYDPLGGTWNDIRAGEAPPPTAQAPETASLYDPAQAPSSSSCEPTVSEECAA